MWNGKVYCIMCVKTLYHWIFILRMVFIHTSYVDTSNTIVSCKNAPLPFWNLSLSTKWSGGAYTWDGTFSLTITPFLPVPCPHTWNKHDLIVSITTHWRLRSCYLWKDVVIGHVLRELARACWYFLKKRYGSVICNITQHRRLSEVEGKGLVTSYTVYLHWQSKAYR